MTTMGMRAIDELGVSRIARKISLHGSAFRMGGFEALVGTRSVENWTLTCSILLKIPC
jgi:hypothetical protein